mgnify:CR=1 FL=1
MITSMNIDTKIPSDIRDIFTSLGFPVDDEEYARIHTENVKASREYKKAAKHRNEFSFDTTTSDAMVDKEVSIQASNWSDKYIDKFEKGECSNPYTKTDGKVYELAQRWFSMPFYAMPEMSMLHIHRFYNVLARSILTSNGTESDERETIHNAKKLYEQGNANVYKVVAFGIIHGFITGTMDLDLIMEFIPDFYNEANGIDHKKIKTWNEAVDMQTDIPEEVRNMFIAEKNGYVEAGHFDDPAEYQAPKDDAPVVTPSANNSEEDISLDVNAAKPMEAVVPQQNPKGAALIASNNNGAPEIVRPNEQPIAAAIRRVASAISQPPQSAGNVTPVTDLHVIDPPKDQVQMVQAITLPGTDPNEQNITFDDVLAGNGVAKAVPVVTPTSEANQPTPAPQAPEVPTTPAQPVASNTPPQIAAVEAGNNELFARTYPGIERLTNLINSFGLVVSYGSSDYPGVIAAGIYNPALLDQHGNWILYKIIGVDYKAIYGDDIRVMPLIKGHDIRCEPSICLHDQTMVTKFILGTITQEDNRMLIDQIPPEIISIHNGFMFVDRMDMSNLPEIIHENWVKLVKNIYKVLGNKSLNNIRFRISSYTNPDKFIMVADNRVSYPFPSKIISYVENTNALADELTVSVDNSKPHKEGEVRYSIRTNKKNSK